MKNTLVKTIIIAALLFCSNLASAKTTINVVQQKKIKADQIIFSSNINKNIHIRRLIPMYSMQTSENLKTYHLGHKFFNPDHKVPTANNLAVSIKSHPFFIGKFTKEPSHGEYASLKSKISHPFFILETSLNNKSDFYMVYSNGIRHFTIQNDKMDNLASYCNSSGKNYPNLDFFIKCTLEAHSDKYLI